MYPIFKKPNSLLKKLGNLTTSFGGKTRGENFHQGVDIAAPEGTAIPAITQGVVTSVNSGNTGFGNTITVKAPNGDTQQFAHLKKALVRPGQNVTQGQTIAKMGHSGSSYSESGGPSDHLDLRIVNAYGRYKNPLTYLKGR